MRENKQRYGKPPIQEAVCEIFPAFADPISEPELTKMAEYWKQEYPVAKIIEDKQAHFQIGVDGIKHLEEENFGKRLICRSEDGIRLSQLSNRLIAVNHLAEYPGWGSGFREMILARFGEVMALFPAPSVSRIGLRYIDRIVIPESPMTWSKWFKVELALPSSFQAPGANLQLSFQNSIDVDLAAKLILTNLPNSPEGTTAVILDLNVVSTQVTGAEDIPNELDRVHAPHSLAFEAVLQDATRELFEPS